MAHEKRRRSLRFRRHRHLRQVPRKASDDVHRHPHGASLCPGDLFPNPPRCGSLHRGAPTVPLRTRPHQRRRQLFRHRRHPLALHRGLLGLRPRPQRPDLRLSAQLRLLRKPPELLPHAASPRSNHRTQRLHSRRSRIRPGPPHGCRRNPPLLRLPHHRFHHQQSPRRHPS